MRRAPGGTGAFARSRGLLFCATTVQMSNNTKSRTRTFIITSYYGTAPDAVQRQYSACRHEILGVIIGAPEYPLNRHNVSTFSGRAPSQLKNHKDREARPVRCNGWLSRLTCGREYILPSVENRRLRTERGSGPSVLCP